jgi:hypothetical protein
VAPVYVFKKLEKKGLARIAPDIVDVHGDADVPAGRSAVASLPVEGFRYIKRDRTGQA